MPKDEVSSRAKRQRKEPTPTKTALRVERAKVEVPHAGLAFNHKHQIFIAKLKRGEIWALNQLSYQGKTTVTPLLEMWPPNPGTPKKPAKTFAQHTTDLMTTLTSEWTGLPCYVDTQYLQSANVPSAGAVQAVFGIARSMNVNCVPVTSPLFAQPFQEAIRSVVATDGRGVMFRLQVPFFNIPDWGQYITGLVNFLGIGTAQVDILIDLQYRPNVVEVQQLGASFLNLLPSINEWRTVTLAAGCFPSSISDEPAGQWIPFSRSDWNGWRTVVAQRNAANLRLPSYGDYGVRCGGEPLVIPNTPAPNIRYSDSPTTWVKKGTKAPGAMRAICADLVNQPYFRGAQFSQGDAEMAQKAATPDQKNGSPEQWIQWCTNHHLELAASEIQSLP